MTTLTPSYSLILYNSTTDQSATFATWRADIDGPASTSNFYRIDTALAGIQTQVTALQSASPVVVVPSVYTAGNYIATGVTGITAYTTNQLIVLSLDTTSSGAVNLNINSLGLKSVMKIDNSGAAVVMAGTELRINKLYLFKYDGVEWIWVNPQTASQINITGTSGNVVTVNSDNTLLGTTTQAALISLTTDAATTKATPVGADELPLADSAASFGLKKLTFTNLLSAWGTLVDGLTAKTSPVAADEILISDSAASNVSKKVTFTNLTSQFGVFIAALTGKTTPVGADGFIIFDSAASNVSKQLTLTNLVAVLKTLIATDTLAATTDITTNNATSSAHGLLPKLSGSATQALLGDGTWGTVSAFWTTVPGTPVRVGNTSFTVTDTANANNYNLLLSRGTIFKWTDTTTKMGMVVTATYASNAVTVTIIGDTLASSATMNTFKYAATKARQWFAPYPLTMAVANDITQRFRAGASLKIYGFDAYHDTAGTTNATTYTVSKNSASGASTINGTISIASAGTNTDGVSATDATTMVLDDYLAWNCTAVSTTAPSGFLGVTYYSFLNDQYLT